MEMENINWILVHNNDQNLWYERKEFKISDWTGVALLYKFDCHNNNYYYYHYYYHSMHLQSS